MNTKSAIRSNLTILNQIIKLIPLSMIHSLAHETGIDKQARDFTVKSHLVAMLFAQLTHALSLNDVCDWMQMKWQALSHFAIHPPRRNTLATANKNRSSLFAEKLLEHLHHQCPSLKNCKSNRGLLRRFRTKVYSVDSTVMQLVANCMDWARHRRCKAAAKMHLRLNLQSFLPEFAIVEAACF